MVKRQKKVKRNKQQYYDYLRSSQWQEKRRLALEFYGYNCGLCGSKFNLQVHHRNYRNIFKESMEDLMLLCDSCHRRFHKTKVWTNGKKSKYMRDPNYDQQPVTYFVPKRK